MCCNLPDAEDMHRQPGCTSICCGGVDERDKSNIHGIDGGGGEVYSPHDALWHRYKSWIQT
jgi:hypothetical protein